MANKVNGVKSIDFGVSDLKAAAKFYTEIWNLTPVADGKDAIYLRGTGAEHHILGLHQRGKGELLRINLSAAGEVEVDALHSAVKAAGLKDIEAPTAIREPGGGYGFSFLDPEGRTVRIIAGGLRHTDTSDQTDRPRKISHCVLNSTDRDAAVGFYTKNLGFKLSDATKAMSFIRCNSDHHSIALVKSTMCTLHHVAFEMPSLDDVMRGGGRLRDAGFPIEWGVGRHGPGANVFAYFVSPDGMVIEYTAEVEQVDDTYPTGTPEKWTWPKGRNDRWGINDGPSKRMHEAESRIAFGAGIFHAAV
jgi:catechol 2,3-dioxygenase-like lactoylglutathione lyase family enzyme